MSMVVGAYTIINTIGLLVGLPLTYTGNTHININNSLQDYFVKESINVEDLSNVFLIVDGSISNPNTNTTQIWVDFTTTINGIYDLTFNYLSTINNYYVFQNYDNNVGSGDNLPSIGYLNSSVNMSINQIYFGVRTEDLTDIDSDSILNSITSGLGLMGDITKQFGNGFSSLIWNSEDNTLTTFGNFALIFLGVSITFAIIKLCLNLIRSKTGA